MAEAWRPQLARRLEHAAKRLGEDEARNVSTLVRKLGRVVINMRYSTLVALLENAHQTYGNFWRDIEAGAIVDRSAVGTGDRMAVEGQLFGAAARKIRLPSVVVGFRSRSCLDKPFHAASDAIGLGYNFTPRGMRRTYQDLARAAGIHDVVTRAISGHATPEMQQRYSTPRGDEVKHALSKVAKIATSGAEIIDIATARRRTVG